MTSKDAAIEQILETFIDNFDLDPDIWAGLLVPESPLTQIHIFWHYIL